MAYNVDIDEDTLINRHSLDRLKKKYGLSKIGDLVIPALMAYYGEEFHAIRKDNTVYLCKQEKIRK